MERGERGGWSDGGVRRGRPIAPDRVGVALVLGVAAAFGLAACAGDLWPPVAPGCPEAADGPCICEDACTDPEGRDDATDDDCDGAPDCDDPDCDGAPSGSGEVCDNGSDDDGDDEVDCDDPDCRGDPGCGRGFRNVGYVSIYFLDHVLESLPWEQYTHLVWQNVWVTSPSDPTLRVQDGYPWSQISTFVAACHDNGVRAIACLFGTGDLASVTSDPASRARLVANLAEMVRSYGLDGINIDWEGGSDPDVYAAFIRELREALGPEAEISAIGTWLGPPVNISAEAEPYLDFITVMTYDYWHVPSYGALEVVSESMTMWASAGFPRDKLVMGIPFFATTGAGTTGWTPYSAIVGTLDPSPSQNSGGGYYWNGPDLVQAKTRWVLDNGFGGVFSYETGTDVLGHPLSLGDAIWAVIDA